MKEKKNLIISFMALLFTLTLPAQSQNNSFTDEAKDLIILDESNDIRIVDDRLEFMMFYFSKELSVKILSDKGIERMSRFVLPEQLDPTYIFHAPKERNYSHVYSRMECEYFKGTISSEDGSSRTFDLQPEVEQIDMMMKDVEYFGSYKKFLYTLDNLKVGDIVKINYRYRVPYQDNFYKLSSFRIFFNSELPKQNYHLTISHHPELFFQTEFLNGAEPDTLRKTEESTVYEWVRENLHGCIDEPGARPYLSLPHVTFSPMTYDLNYIVKKSFEPRFTPFYSLYASSREEKHKAITLSVIQGVNTPSYLAIRRFVNQQSKEFENDTLGIKKMQKIHQTITDEFNYGDNLEYFTREDRRDPKVGDQINNRTLRDLSRNDLYLAMLLELDLNYRTAYLSDNRSGIISDHFFSSMYDSDFLYAAFSGNGEASFFYPKRARYGYYMNELPFYFENTRTRLVHLTDYNKREGMINEEFIEAFTPISPGNSNIRNTRVAVNINLEQLSSEFQAQIYLSGQFSTMTRGLYLYDYRHDKVNDLYNKKVWEINEQVEVNNKEVSIETKEPPFTTRIKCLFRSDNIISRNDKEYSLSLDNWFNHIISADLKAQNRQMKFYPDFSHRDSYTYFIKFDQKIEISEEFSPITVTTDHINLNIQIDQLDSQSIKIESFFALTGVIDIDEITQLEKAFTAIEKLNKSKLTFTAGSNE